MILLTLLEEFNTASVCFRLIISALLGGIIGIERGRHGRAAGLRTHILVCLGAAMTSLMSLFTYYSIGSDTGDVFRIPAQVISGIGFLGAGTILVKNKSVVMGLTTAAGIWCTAAIGIAVGYGFYLGAVVCALIEIVTTTLLTAFEHKNKRIMYFYAEIHDTSLATDAIRDICSAFPGASVDIVSSKSGTNGSIGISISVQKNCAPDECLETLTSVAGVVFAAEQHA